MGDARSALPPVERLAEAMALEDWVAEEPEAHLLPHLEKAAEALGLGIARAETRDGAFEVEITGARLSGAELRSVVMGLVGSVAEASTHVRQVGEGEFEIVTGTLSGDSPAFATHGHLLRIRLV